MVCPETFKNWPLESEIILQPVGGVLVSQSEGDIVLRSPTGTVFDFPSKTANHEFALNHGSSSSRHPWCLYKKQIQNSNVLPAPIELIPLSSKDTSDLLEETNRLWQTKRKTARVTAAAILAGLFEKVHMQEGALRDFIAQNVAAAYFDIFEYQQALNFIEKSRPIYPIHTTTGQHLTVIESHIYLRQDRATEAEQKLSNLITQLEAQPLTRMVLNLRVQATSMLAEAKLILNKTMEAKALLDTAIVSLSKENLKSALSPDILATLYDNAGYLYIKLSNENTVRRPELLKKALDMEFEALASGLTGVSQTRKAILHSNIGWVFKSLGALDSAQRNYLIALSLLGDNDDEQRESVIYRNLGRTYLALGLYSKAIIYLKRAQELTYNQTPVWNARIDCFLGEAYLALRNQQQAAIAATRCLDFFSTTTSSADDLARALTLQFYLLKNEGSELTARDAIATRLFHVMGAITDNDVLANALQAKGEYQWMKSNASSALTTLSQAIDIAKTSADPTLAIKMQMHLTHKLIESKNVSQVEHTINETTASIIQTLSEIEPFELGPAWSGTVDGFFATVISYFIAQNSPQSIQKALETSELIRGINLKRAVFHERREVNENTQTTLDKISALSTQIISHQDTQYDSLSLALNIETDLLKLKHHSGPKSLSQREVEHYRSLTPHALPTDTVGITPLNAKEILSILSPSEMGVHYLVNQNTIGAFFVSSQTIEYKHIGSVDELSKLNDLALEAIASRSWSVADRLSELGKALFKQIDITRFDQIYIAPHQFLHNVPFSALYLEAFNASLGELASVTMLPSLSSKTLHKPRTSSAESFNVAVFTDPFISHSSGKENWLSSLPSLPWSKLEATHLKTLFGEESTVSFSGHRANRKHLLTQQSRNATILHIATHSYFNEESPLNVGFTLATEDEFGIKDPGFVTFSELSQYPFSNQLVMINGCQTALGINAHGEGLMSMARSFLSSGAENVVATLWPVSDRASLTFMAYFYDALSETGSVSEALARARSNMRNNRRFAHPFYWAAYTHYSITGIHTISIPD